MRLETLLVVLLAGSLSACASMPPKKLAAGKLSAVAHSLGAARDAERPLAAGLPAAKQREIDQAFAAALDAHAKASAAIDAWKKGDPPPAALHQLRVNAEAALVAVQGLSGNPSVMPIADSLQQAIDDIASIQGTLTAGS